jgi:hypothetical protein
MRELYSEVTVLKNMEEVQLAEIKTNSGIACLVTQATAPARNPVHP